MLDIYRFVGFFKSYSKFIQSIPVDTPSESVRRYHGYWVGIQADYSSFPLVSRSPLLIHAVAMRTVLREVRARPHTPPLCRRQRAEPSHRGASSHGLAESCSAASLRLAADAVAPV